MDYIRRIARRQRGNPDAPNTYVQDTPHIVFSTAIEHQIVHDGEQVDEMEVEEEIQEEHESTLSFVAETTRWERMRQAGQKLSESALTVGTIRQYEK
jgi:hypothetical protein